MKRLLVALLFTAFASTAVAHETVLLPSSFVVPRDAPVTLALTSMATFPAPETGPKPARVEHAFAMIAARKQGLAISGHEPTALRFTVTPRRRGAMVAAVALGPHDIDLTADKVAEYFEEIEPSPNVRAAYAAGPGDLHETYTKYAKSFVCVVTCGDALQTTRPVGHALEFVATPGATVDFRRITLLAGGAPEAGCTVIAWSETAHAKLTTDGAGRLVLPTDLHGRVMLSATILRPPATPGARFTSDFVTLTLALN